MHQNYSTSLIDLSDGDESTLDDMFRLRYRVFQGRLNWKVRCEDGRERDQYDDKDSLYMVTKNREGKVVGCWRLRSSMNSYMLKDTFPDLLRGDQCPKDDAIWELSRFAVDTSDDGSLQSAAISSVTYHMVRSVFDLAKLMGIDSYVTVTTCAVQRLMVRAKIPMHRFGDQRATNIDSILSVACWIPINDSFRKSVRIPVPEIVIETNKVTAPRKRQVVCSSPEYKSHFALNIAQCAICARLFSEISLHLTHFDANYPAIAWIGPPSVFVEHLLLQ